MAGRDIGTVVLPQAQLKIFLTASVEERARRRYLEMQEKGIPATLESVTENLRSRDHIDSTRADSPLRAAPDSITVDATLLSAEQVVEEILKLAAGRNPGPGGDPAPLASREG